MNYLKKFQPVVASTEQKNELPKKRDPVERILTVDIKTMRTHMRNEMFNNSNTLLEIFRKFSHIFYTN